MEKIKPTDYVEPEKEGGVLEISEKKEAELIAKAIELLGEDALSLKELMDRVEAFYVADNVHYTSAQLKDVCEKAGLQLNPPIELEVEEVIPEVINK